VLALRQLAAVLLLQMLLVRGVLVLDVVDVQRKDGNCVPAVTFWLRPGRGLRTQREGHVEGDLAPEFSAARGVVRDCRSPLSGIPPFCRFVP
jgi:hypothetical protein